MVEDYYRILRGKGDVSGSKPRPDVDPGAGAFDESEPCYVISIAARLVGVHAQTLRYYERAGLIEPSRSRGKIRLYSRRDIDRIRHIKTLMDDLGSTWPGWRPSCG